MRIRKNRSAGYAALIFLCAAAHAWSAVSISNLFVSQREGTKLVDIFFDAEYTSGSSVGISVVVSNGISKVNANAFSGDIGGTVPAGNNLHIIWDGGSDLPSTATSNLSITVQVSDPVPACMV